MVATDLKNKIPEGWKRTFLSESSNFRIVGSRVNHWKGLKPYLSTKSVQGTVIAEIEDYVSFNNRPSRANMQPEVGVTAFAKMGDTFKVLYNDEEIAKNYILSTGFCLVKPKIDPKYFFHFVASNKFQNNKELYCEGSTQKAISQKDYDKLEILFPENPKEQQKIAEVLTTIDDVIEKTDAIIEKNKRIKQGLMQDLFRYGIDEIGNIRSEKTHKFKTVKIGNEEIRIPEEWGVKDLDYFFKVIDPHPSHRAPSVALDGVPFVGIGDISEDGNIFEGARKVSFKIVKEQRSRFVIEPGDLGFGRVATIGKIIKFNHTNNFFCVSPTMAILKPIGINKSFAFHFLNSYIMKFQVQNLLTGSTRSSLGIELLRKIQIVILKEYEQKKIGEMFDSIDMVIKNECVNKQKLLSLKLGLMDDLLTGKVRVNSLIN